MIGLNGHGRGTGAAGIVRRVGHGLHRGGEYFETRARMGGRRLGNNWLQLAQVVAGAAIAYAFCYYVLGHTYPFLAAVGAAVGTGVIADRRVRRALEYLCGATAGVLVGEAMVNIFGSGVWQLAIVMTIGLTIGTLINSGGIFVTQVGIQSIYVVTVPPEIGAHPFDRTLDAVVGAGLALLMALVVPGDARKIPRYRAATMLEEIAQLLTDCGSALRTGDKSAERKVLARARDTQSLIDDWRSSLRISQEATRINARARRHAAEVNRLARACEYADRAIRTTRIIARRAVTVANPEHPRPEVGDLMVDLGAGADKLCAALRRGTPRVGAEAYLSQVAARLDPKAEHFVDIHDETLVILMRLLVVDLLQASGMTDKSANEQLPAFRVDEE
ncbi:FUSC family protein [Brevibacterium sp. 50QC2O2]|uniref:FUSC family protein n=1 Tax=Brevibacterium TaxID=1696 RepID=UPI00211B7DCC|nr:FUSC family protein [Brevibacterium sp. 91QC2O2]MCQ9385997.1 FUSC family protein [Brevibacterium sp. 68QC2CO]MCQ9387712.1 FUSC family protein [Brevibacterium sp. 50QC2O2]